jgi:hypothetical protein
VEALGSRVGNPQDAVGTEWPVIAHCDSWPSIAPDSSLIALTVAQVSKSVKAQNSTLGGHSGCLPKTWRDTYHGRVRVFFPVASCGATMHRGRQRVVAPAGTFASPARLTPAVRPTPPARVFPPSRRAALCTIPLPTMHMTTVTPQAGTNHGPRSGEVMVAVSLAAHLIYLAPTARHTGTDATGIAVAARVGPGRAVWAFAMGGGPWSNSRPVFNATCRIEQTGHEPKG